VVRYCVSFHSKDGVRFDSKNMEALQTTQEPQNGADMLQYVAAVNWMRSAITNYSASVAPLQAALAKRFDGRSRMIKKSAAAVSLLHIWGPEEKAAFKYLQTAIVNSMTLAFPEPNKIICVLKDSFDHFDAGLVSQIHEEQLHPPMEKQDQQPLAFLSGELKGAQQRWTVPEREGFAIFNKVTKVDYLLPSHDEFSILSDHRNLPYFTNLLGRPHSSAPCCTQVTTLDTKDVRVLLPHGARYGRAQLLDRPYDEMGSRVNSRLRAQITWQDRQPIFTAVHQSARLRYGEVSVQQGGSTVVVERCQCVREISTKQRDGSSRSTAAASRCCRHEDDE
jgi:RNase H-like domain found in reverse transcriptase